jgi:hypothetical protein
MVARGCPCDSCVADTADRDVYATAVGPRYGFSAKHLNEIVKEYLQKRRDLRIKY